jgi:hypothetical protein
MPTPATIDEFTSQYDRHLLRVRGWAIPRGGSIGTSAIYS